MKISVRIKTLKTRRRGTENTEKESKGKVKETRRR